MEADSSPLLAQLIDHTRPPAPGRDDFKTALRRLNLNSVFDIVRLPEGAFAEQLARYNDDDAHTVYLKAQSAAAQLETLFREQQVSSPPSSPRNKRSITPETSATYQALFDENWHQFCSSSSIAAVDSPTAYLRALYIFALQLEGNTKDTNALKLSQRRPKLKDLMINPQSVSGQVPMLSIVNEILLENITQAEDKDKDKEVYALLSGTWYPFSLPYHFHHQQCQQGLSGNKPALGELNYRISRQLPLVGETSTYGQVREQNNEVQCQLSGLSPQQQTLLKNSLVAQADAKSFYRNYYNWETDTIGPVKLTDFLRHTQLDGEQLQALLAQQTQSPRVSPYCKQDTGLTYGACYINGTATPTIRLDNGTPAKLTNVSLQRFDRLQRMIRLQRWLGLPFAQLDTLLVSAMRCEDKRDRARLITHNTLRALGVFCYLSKRYTLQAEEFAAWLHQLPVHASGERVSLFDQVFNRAGCALPPLYLDSKPFDDTTRQQLCAGLGLQDTQDSLQLLISSDKPATRTIETVSEIYRQARIARLFGVSVVECRQLVQMLGNANLLTQLRNPTLRENPQGMTDFLDMLMSLEWASRWFKENGSSLALFRRQLLLDQQVQDPAINQLLMAFVTYDQGSFSKALQQLNFSQQPTGEKDRLPAIDWESLAYTALQRMRATTSIEVALDQVLSPVQISTDPQRQADLIDQEKAKLKTLLTTVGGKLRALSIRLNAIIQAVPHAPGNANGYQKYDNDRHYLRLHAPADPPLQTLGYLILRLPHAANILQLPLSPHALHQFLVNPHWLASEYKASSLLELTPHNLYLMQQFKHCIDRSGVTQEQLLNYFEQANSLPNGATQNASKETNERLAQLLSWSASEIDVFCDPLKPPRITSMDRLDWVLRCRQASLDTGLPAHMLIKACELKTDSTFAQWKVVGEAITSAHP
ncbi:virulence plasmid A protein [Pseudomonas antarctica]|uniref:Virulence plasmid A protein n=2 Tax=Pseudomonas antarctica TaxID=219572 RepID=A0A1G9YYG8_9PSED|nr:Tc toxin subunit A [Pseudomonas antarctica]KAF2410887.1 hypothetical protein PSAN_33200 [Pseudomonas antarctica]SDN14209.1 virulence plasmid A protein [Pseudomonas antarctica]